ncbi:MAG: hypothetical protein JSU01_00370 [Bacteroidetes bacterium]|nr:hypothetical protein [Bacteroidota bacterium]
MPRVVIFRVIFAFAALLFVAKPFLGFCAFAGQTQPRISHTVLVKSFTKRKPESLEEGYAKARALHALISDPPFVLQSVIILFLAVLLPTSLENTGKPPKIEISFPQPIPAYLLTGKLSI